MQFSGQNELNLVPLSDQIEWKILEVGAIQ